MEKCKPINHRIRGVCAHYVYVKPAAGMLLLTFCDKAFVLTVSYSSFSKKIPTYDIIQ